MAANTSTTSPHRTNPSLTFVKDDQGKMIIWPKELNIVWGNDSRYWNMPDDDKNSPAVLNQVYWLEVTSSVGNTDQSKEYEVGFQVSLTPDAFGWAKSPLYIMVKRGKDGKFEYVKRDLDQNETEVITIKKKLRASSENINNKDDGGEHAKIYFGIYEVWSGMWKGGLQIHHAFVRELS